MSLVIKFEPGLRPVIKHQEHDQSSHGSWANGNSESSLISTETQIAFNEGAIKATDNILSPSAYKSQLDGNLNRTYPKTYLEEAVNNPAYQDALQTHLKSIGFPETVKVFSSSAQEGEYFHGSVAPLWDSGAVGYESEESPKEFSVNRSDIIGLGKVADSGVWFRNAKAVKKHQQGTHDQRTHGSWAGSGGAGVDITDALDEVFFNRKLKIEPSRIFPSQPDIPIRAEIERAGLNKETVDLIDKMSEAQVASGQAYGDNALKIIAERQGFTGKPKTVKTLSDLEEMQSENGGILVYRGIANYSAEKTEKVTYSAEQALTDFREGEYFGGWGVFGNGTYATSNYNEADNYKNFFDIENGKVGKGKMMAMLIPKGAKAPSEDIVKLVVKQMVYGGEPSHRNNVGRRLASMGYQYYDASYVQDDKVGTYVILDRSMLTVAEKEVKL